MKQPLQAKNEQGFVSIVIAMTLILVLALTTVGFAQLARREQQQALTRQLSNQAYYAAESGVNDAISDIKNGHLSGNISSCQSGSAATAESSSPGILASNTGPQVSSGTGVAYSCVLVNQFPTSASYTLKPDQGKSVEVTTTSAIDRIHIHWASDDSNQGLANCSGGVSICSVHPLLPQLGSVETGNPATSQLGVVQFSITPVSSSMNAQTLSNSNYTTYLYPFNKTTGTSFTTIGYTNQGLASGNAEAMYVGSCTPQSTATSTSAFCDADITGLSSNTNSYLVHFINYYDTSDITITGYYGTSPTPVPYKNTQAIIDATGRAQGTLRRIQVRVPLVSTTGSGVGSSVGAGTTDLPDYALEAQSICKRQQTLPGTTTYSTPAGGSVSDCTLDQ